MNQMLITVVLPIYKVEKYLDRCIESVVHQTYRNLEILLIDDGSPDRCPAMCDEWALKDRRIRVIHKKNAGLGEARNTGIENASGSYICFFDSDDYIHPQTIEKCVARLNKDHADVVIFGVNCVSSTGKITASYPPSVGEITYRGKEVQENFLLELIAPTVQRDGSRSFYMSTWVMLYSMEKIRSIQWKFVSERDIISEDVYSLLYLFRFVQAVSVIPEAFYFYCENNASLSRKYIKDRYKRVKDFYLKSQELCEKIGYGDIVKRQVMKPYLMFTIAAMKQEIKAGKPVREQIRVIKEIIRDPVLQEVLKKVRKDTFRVTRAIMFFCMRNSLFLLCYILLRLKT